MIMSGIFKTKQLKENEQRSYTYLCSGGRMVRCGFLSFEVSELCNSQKTVFLILNYSRAVQGKPHLRGKEY